MVSTCRATPLFVETVTKINELVTADFAAAREYSIGFEEHRKVHDFGRDWDFEQYTSKKRYALTTVRGGPLTLFLHSGSDSPPLPTFTTSPP